MDEVQVWGKMLRPVWDMDGMTGPGDIQGEAFTRLLVHGRLLRREVLGWGLSYGSRQSKEQK